MTSDDKPKFVSVLVGLKSIKPGPDLTKEAFEMWWSSMRDWSIDEFAEAASALSKSVEFMPNPYHFEQLRQRIEPSPYDAWASVVAHCAGAYRAGPLECNRTSAVVAALGGYQTIATMPTDKLGFIERRFLAMYEDFRESDQARLALPNMSERTTRRGGEPTLLADVTKRISRQ